MILVKRVITVNAEAIYKLLCKIPSLIIPFVKVKIKNIDAELSVIFSFLFFFNLKGIYKNLNLIPF